MRHPLLNNESIRLYNLFPRLIGNMTSWKGQLDRICDMGFNAIWVNPFHYPGFSGSLYSPKDYYEYNPLFIDKNSSLSPKDQLKSFVDECHKKQLLLLMDLVINHTAIDCPLIQTNPSWFKHDSQGNVVNPGAMHEGKWHKWGDLAEVDNENSPDRENLWNYWWKLIEHYLDLGIDGFRCDMAYQLPPDLWLFLISQSRAKKDGCIFTAESLGCDFKQVKILANLGFDYLFNSVKYWNFNDSWGMEQYYSTSNLTSSISFPESHDTPRLMSDLNGNVTAVKQRMLFSALFSSGYMIPTGFEYGFKKQLHVVKSDPTWWETTGIDLSGFMRQIADLKKAYRVLNIESGLSIVDQANWANVFCFKRQIEGEKTIFVIMNKDTCNSQHVYIPDLEAVAGPCLTDLSLDTRLSSLPRTLDYLLKPSEIIIIGQK